VADEAILEDKRVGLNNNCRWITGPDSLLLPEEDWPKKTDNKLMRV
jgi:hypothetical protein